MDDPNDPQMESMLPLWVQPVFDAFSEAMEFHGLAFIEGRYLEADENTWGLPLLELSPALLEIEEAGPNDGEEIYGILHAFDLLAAQQAYDQVDGLTFGFENDGQPVITFEGRVAGRELIVQVRTLPFDDAEISGTVG